MPKMDCMWDKIMAEEAVELTYQQGRSAASGDVRDPAPGSQRYIDISKLKFAEKTSRLMSPFRKDKAGHES